jgi:hypothetical protein
MALERDLLELTAEELEQDGYTVLLDPSSSMLPSQFRDLHPDAIAIGKQPHLLIEVAYGDQRSSDRVQQFQNAIRGNKEWALHLVYSGNKPSGELTALTLLEIVEPIQRIQGVAEKDARAALLMCWATLEALARALLPKAFPRAQTPGRIVERLAGFAYITPSTAVFLRSMALKRNEFIHGQLLTSVHLGEISKFIAILESLVSEARAEGLR